MSRRCRGKCEVFVVLGGRARSARHWGKGNRIEMMEMLGKDSREDWRAVQRRISLTGGDFSRCGIWFVVDGDRVRVFRGRRNVPRYVTCCAIIFRPHATGPCLDLASRHTTGVLADVLGHGQRPSEALIAPDDGALQLAACTCGDTMFEG